MALLCSALLVLATVWLTLAWLRRRDHVARRERSARARLAERDARRVLENKGFVVLSEQARQNWSVLADGELVQFELIADYLVARAGERWVAEVKTGSRALSLRFGPTRRQLLEYREAFGVDGVLLVDAENDGVRQIHFRAPARRASACTGPLWRGARAALWLSAGTVLGLILAKWLG